MDSTPPLDIHDNLVLLGLSGSRLYGNSHADSDYDWRGLFIAPTVDFLGLKNPKDTLTLVEPDTTVYEVGKFLRLTVKGNPNLLELIWMPTYEVITPIGQQIIDARYSLLSTKAIRSAYYGFAKSQMMKAMDHERDGVTGTRRDKTIRHAFRVAKQGIDLLTTGDMNPVVQDIAFLYSFEKLDGEALWNAWTYEALKPLLEVNSVLPEETDTEVIDDLLVQIRLNHL